MLELEYTVQKPFYAVEFCDCSEGLFPDRLQENERTVEYGVDIELKFIHPT